MRAALATALLIIATAGCRRDATEGSAPSTSASPGATPAAASGAVASEPTSDEAEAGPTSRWSKTSTEPVELGVAPNRAAFVAFEAKNGGYVLHRRDEKTTRLPREWIGAGRAAPRSLHQR